MRVDGSTSALDMTGAERLQELLAALSAVSMAIASSPDLDELFQTIYQETARVLDTTGFILGLYHEANQTVEIVKQIDSGAELPGGSFPLGAGFTSQVIRTREPRLIRQWTQEGPRVQVQYATHKPGLPESGITVPLIAGDRVIGVLSVQSYQPEAYDANDLLALQVIAGQAAAAIENLRRSERLDAQLQRRVSEQEAILTNMADALLIVDGDGCIMRINRAARELLGLDSHGIVFGQPLDREQWGQWPLGAQAVAEALGPMIEGLRRGEACREFELRGDGRRVLSFSCAPLPDEHGALTGGVIVFRDVTGRREVERLKDEVLAIASHDLKAPVAVLKGQAQLLTRQISVGRATPEGLTKGLDLIVGQADRLVELLNLLLDLSRLEAGRLELRPRPADLVALADALVEGVQAMTDRHQIVMSAPERVEGRWDEQRLGQVLQNLLTNAVKYSPDGGKIEVVIQADEQQATICVTDEGIGIGPDDLPHLFGRFYRAEGTRRLEGSGLGLYICQGIIAAHGGRIWAESAGAGQGSAFYFTVPRGHLDGAAVTPDSLLGLEGDRS